MKAASAITEQKMGNWFYLLYTLKIENKQSLKANTVTSTLYYICVCWRFVIQAYTVIRLSCYLDFELLSWAFNCGASSLRQKCGGYEVSGVLMSNSLVHLCDSNLSECLIGWWLTGLLSFVDCALILVVVGEVPVVGFLVVVTFRMFVGWVPVVEDNELRVLSLFESMVDGGNIEGGSVHAVVGFFEFADVSCCCLS